MHNPLAHLAPALNNERTARLMSSPIRVSAHARRFNALYRAAPLALGEFMGVTPVTATLAVEPDPNVPGGMDWSSTINVPRAAMRKMKRMHRLPFDLAGDVAVMCWGVRRGTSPDWTAMINAMHQSCHCEECARRRPSVAEHVAVCVALEALLGHPDAPLWPAMMGYCRALMHGASERLKAWKRAA